MDYYLDWIMGRQIYEGSDAAERVAAAAEIADGDATSWQRAWHALAERVEAEAHTALGRGDQIGARNG